MQDIFAALILDDLGGGFFHEPEEVGQPNGDEADGESGEGGPQPKWDFGFLDRFAHGYDAAHINEGEECGDEADDGEEWVLTEGEFGGGGEVLEAIKEAAVMDGHGVAGHGGDGDGGKGAERVVADDGFVRENDGGNGGVKGGGNGAGNAAAEKGDGVGAAEFEDSAEAGAECGAQMHGGAIAANRCAEADGAYANERGGDAFADGHDAVVIDAGDDGVGGPVAAREFEGNIEQPNEKSAADEGSEDMPLRDVGEGALFVVKPNRVVRLGARQMRGELSGIGVGDDGDEIFAVEF